MAGKDDRVGADLTGPGDHRMELVEQCSLLDHEAGDPVAAFEAARQRMHPRMVRRLLAAPYLLRETDEQQPGPCGHEAACRQCRPDRGEDRQSIDPTDRVRAD